MVLYGQWLSDQTWDTIYGGNNCHNKADMFQDLLMGKYYEIFPLKTFKGCPEDKPWFSKSLKILDRKRKREFHKNQKSQKWKDLNS